MEALAEVTIALYIINLAGIYYFGAWPIVEQIEAVKALFTLSMILSLIFQLILFVGVFFPRYGKIWWKMLAVALLPLFFCCQISYYKEKIGEYAFRKALPGMEKIVSLIDNKAVTFAWQEDANDKNDKSEVIIPDKYRSCISKSCTVYVTNCGDGTVVEFLYYTSCYYDRGFLYSKDGRVCKEIKAKWTGVRQRKKQWFQVVRNSSTEMIGSSL